METQQLMAERAALLEQIQALQKQVDTIDATVKNAARLQIRALMLETGLTIDQLLPAPPGPKKAAGQRESLPLYRNPASGKTWSGRGRAPDWIASATNRESFRVARSA